MSCSIIVPTLNEEKNVERIFNVIKNIFKNINVDWELIYVDDKSSDDTVVKILNIKSNNDNVKLIHSPERKGLGNALSIGWKKAVNDFIMFLDCDSHVPTKDLMLLINSRAKHTVIVGSRYLSKSRINGAPKIKVFFSKTLNFIISKLLNIKIKDISHSLRIFPNDYINVGEILTHPGYFWGLSLRHQLMGYTLKEIPITFNEREEGLTKNSSIKMLKSVLKTLTILYKIKNE